jgi:hypothetical protein
MTSTITELINKLSSIRDSEGDLEVFISADVAYEHLERTFGEVSDVLVEKDCVVIKA